MWFEMYIEQNSDGYTLYSMDMELNPGPQFDFCSRCFSKCLRCMTLTLAHHIGTGSGVYVLVERARRIVCEGLRWILGSS